MFCRVTRHSHVLWAVLQGFRRIWGTLWRFSNVLTCSESFQRCSYGFWEVSKGFWRLGCVLWCSGMSQVLLGILEALSSFECVTGESETFFYILRCSEVFWGIFVSSERFWKSSWKYWGVVRRSEILWGVLRHSYGFWDVLKCFEESEAFSDYVGCSELIRSVLRCSNEFRVLFEKLPKVLRHFLTSRCSEAFWCV